MSEIRTAGRTGLNDSMFCVSNSSHVHADLDSDTANTF